MCEEVPWVYQKLPCFHKQESSVGRLCWSVGWIRSTCGQLSLLYQVSNSLLLHTGKGRQGGGNKEKREIAP